LDRQTLDRRNPDESSILRWSWGDGWNRLLRRCILASATARSFLGCLLALVHLAPPFLKRVLLFCHTSSLGETVEGPIENSRPREVGRNAGQTGRRDE